MINVVVHVIRIFYLSFIFGARDIGCDASLLATSVGGKNMCKTSDQAKVLPSDGSSSSLWGRKG